MTEEKVIGEMIDLVNKQFVEGLISRGERNIKLFSLIITDASLDLQEQFERMREYLSMDKVRYILNGCNRPKVICSCMSAKSKIEVIHDPAYQEPYMICKNCQAVGDTKTDIFYPTLLEWERKHLIG